MKTLNRIKEELDSFELYLNNPVNNPGLEHPFMQNFSVFFLIFITKTLRSVKATSVEIRTD